MKNKILPILLLSLCTCSTTLHAQVAYETCPSQKPYHILVNKTHPISKDYIPENLVMPRVAFESPGNIQKNYMDATAAKALEEMFEAAKKQGIHLVAVSGYRSYSRQSTLYNRAVASLGSDQNGTAPPGKSEHQTGLAMDLNSISQSFEYTKEGQWLKHNAHLYGYIIRYPKDKTEITGYIYEPWHVRYVGKELANYCYTNNVTLEEITNCCFPYKSINTQITNSLTGHTSQIDLIPIEATTYIKARDLHQLIHADLAFTPSKALQLTSNSHVLTIRDDQLSAGLDDQSITLNHAPFLIEGTYYLPLRDTLQNLGYQLTFENTSSLLIH